MDAHLDSRTESPKSTTPRRRLTLPLDWSERLQLIDWMTPDYLADISEALSLGSRRLDRARAKLGFPDAEGHWRYRGALPAYGNPRVQSGGERMPLIRFARIVAGLPDFGPDAVYERDPACRVMDCFSPYHWRQPTPIERERDAPDLIEAAWLIHNPRPPRPRQVPLPEHYDLATDRYHCKYVFAHTITAYAGARRNSGYCAPCAEIEREWERSLDTLRQHVADVLAGFSDWTPAEQALISENARRSGDSDSEFFNLGERPGVA